MKNKRFDQLARLGCVVCRVYYKTWSEPHIHHLLGIKYRAMGKKANNSDTIPLCPTHHQYGNDEHPSVHGQPWLFLNKFGTQKELLDMTNKMLEEMR